MLSHPRPRGVQNRDLLLRPIFAAHPARWRARGLLARDQWTVAERFFTPSSTAGLRTVDNLRSLPEGQSEQLDGALTVMGYLLQGISPGTTWTGKVRSLIESSFVALPARTVAEMGLPEHWREERLWSPSAPSGPAAQ